MHSVEQIAKAIGDHVVDLLKPLTVSVSRHIIDTPWGALVIKATARGDSLDRPLHWAHNISLQEFVGGQNEEWRAFMARRIADRFCHDVFVYADKNRRTKGVSDA